MGMSAEQTGIGISTVPAAQDLDPVREHRKEKTQTGEEDAEGTADGPTLVGASVPLLSRRPGTSGLVLTGSLLLLALLLAQAAT